MTDEQLQHLAQTVADAIAKQYNKRRGSRIPVPVPMSYELELKEPKTAGMATTNWELGPVKKIVGQSVALNMTVFRDNVSVFLNVVVPHELAHLDQHWQDFQTQSVSQSHGYVWQGSMRAMAQVPKATINLDFSKAERVYREHKAAQKKKAADLKKKLKAKEA